METLRSSTEESGGGLFEDVPIDRSQKMLRLWRFALQPHAAKTKLEMVVYSESELPSYSALSYMWGSYDDAETVHVNGRDLVITKNLSRFLAVLRKDGRFTTDWFWADQISLNQSDTEERNHQVLMMGDIYANAQSVLSYIGSCDSCPDFEPTAMCDVFALGSLSTRKTINVAISLLHLFSEAYWTRLWIVQEIRLTKQATIWYGEHSVSRLTLYKNAYWLKHEWSGLVSRTQGGVELDMHNETFATFEATSYERVRSLLDTWSGEHFHDFQGDDILAVLERYFACECSDPRDKIFGLQSLIPTEERMKIDYSLSWTELSLRVLSDLTARYQWPRLVGSRNWFRTLPQPLLNAMASTTVSPSGFSSDSKAFSWAIDLARLPNDMRRYGRRMTLETQSGRQDWTEMWARVKHEATTLHQQRLASYLHQEANFLQARLWAGVSGHSVEAEAWRTLYRPSDIHEARSDALRADVSRLITRGAAQYGFLLYGDFLYHPSEWPFPDRSAIVYDCDAYTASLH